MTADMKTLAEPEFLAHEEGGLPAQGPDSSETTENRLIYVDEVYQQMEEYVFVQMHL